MARAWWEKPKAKPVKDTSLRYGVFEWHEWPFYTWSEAKKVYRSQSAAERYARDNSLVVRPSNSETVRGFSKGGN